MDGGRADAVLLQCVVRDLRGAMSLDGQNLG